MGTGAARVTIGVAALEPQRQRRAAAGQDRSLEEIMNATTRLFRHVAAGAAACSLLLAGCEKTADSAKGVVLAPPGATNRSTLPAGVDLADVKIDEDILTPRAEATVPASSGALGAGEPIEAYVKTEALSDDKALAEAIGELGWKSPTKSLRALVEANKVKARAALLAAMWHERTNVRSRSVSILQWIVEAKDDGKDLVEAFTRSLRKEPDKNVRALVAKAQVKLQTPSLAPLLIEVLANDKTGDVRANAAYALGTMDDSAAVLQLQLALKDSETWVRLRSVTALRRLRARKAIPQLEQMLADENVEVREAAVRALKELTGRTHKQRPPPLRLAP